MANVKDIDLGWKRIKEELALAKNSFTKIGVQVNTKHEPSDKGSRPKKTVDMVVIAASNEFGTKTIPARPSLRTAFDENKHEINALIKDEYSKILKGESTVKKSLALVGEFMEAKIKKKITEIRTPPNAVSTIKRKKSSNPLIDTGQFRASIRHVEEINK